MAGLLWILSIGVGGLVWALTGDWRFMLIIPCGFGLGLTPAFLRNR
jgi:hypothetical protein